MTAARKRVDPAEAVAQWNATVKVGDMIDYRAHDAGGAIPQRFTTRTAAEVLNGHTAVVWLNGKAGCVAISHCTPVPAAAALEVEYLASENCRILLIEGHVDLDAAAAAIRAEAGHDDYPLPRHTWMRYTEVPEGESADWWRTVCEESEADAQPVTLSMVNH